MLYPDTVEVLGFQLSVAACCDGATPLPDSVTFAGEPVAPLTMVNRPGSFPAADGPNCTPIVSFCEGDSVTGAAAPLIV
jgi:hypothetical protein